jgi:hypothetical protein
MKLFKVTFVMNEIEECKEITSEFAFSGVYHYEHFQGKLIYAIIRAENKEAAHNIAHTIIKEMSNKPGQRMTA